MSATQTARQMAITAAEGAADKQAQNIVLIDVSDRLAITDLFVIASGTNDRQVSAIVDAVEEKLRAAGHKPARREGERDGKWVLLDFVDIVVHVQNTEERVFYALERLWRDCPTFSYEDGPDGANLTADDLVRPGATPEGAPVDVDESAVSDLPELDPVADDAPAAGSETPELDPATKATLPEVDEVPLGHS